MIRKTIFLLWVGGLLNITLAWADGAFDQAKTAHERGDYAAEVAIFRPMAEKGSAVAQFNLGVLYDRGQGVPQDNALAMQWYRKAAEQGLPQAQVNLAIMYEEGQGVPVDNMQAYFWYAMADSQGDGQAPQALRDVVKKMTSEQVADAERQVKEYKATHTFPIAPLPTFNSGSAHGGG